MTDPTEDLEVRVAVRADVHSLGAFLTTAWTHAGPDALGFAGATDEVIAELAEPDTLRGLIADPARTILIASTGFVIVGFAAIRTLAGDTAELAGIIVGAEHRERGIGARLIEAAFEVAREGGVHRMIVRTELHNDPAISFYEAHGFTRVGPVREQVGSTSMDVLELAARITPVAAADRHAFADVDCVFCRITHHEAPASLAYEDDDIVAFMDLYPVTPGHLLVVPKQHRIGLADLPPELGARMFTVAQQLASALRNSPLRTDGFNLFLADGEVAMQEVPHVHLHVIPRFADDGFGIHANRGASNPTRAELDRHASIVRGAMPGA